MKLFTRLMPLFLACLMVVSFGPTTAFAEEPAEFTIWMPSYPTDYYSDYSENAIVQYLNERFNVKLYFQQPAAGTEQEAFNMLISTGEYTDMMALQYSTVSAQILLDEGIIVNLMDYIDNMPNFKAILENDEEARKAFLTDDGKLLALPVFYTEGRPMWGGLVYRRDILETMTGGNIAFPSGNDIPTTVEDWDYMLPLFKAYFEAAQMPQFAALMIPYNGYFPAGELVSGFGAAPFFYLEGDTVKFGPTQQGFYNYLKKMNEWYEAGYVDADFASRVNDPFYLPNTAMTYGAAAGAWFGLSSQMGGAMSMPQYNLFVNVKAMASPLDTQNGVETANVRMTDPRIQANTSYVVSTACDDIPRLLSTLDFLFSEEGSKIKGLGLDKAHGAAHNPIYQAVGATEGIWTEDNGDIKRSERVLVGGDLASTGIVEALTDQRLPGIGFIVPDETAETVEADAIWQKYPATSNYPSFATRTLEEDKVYNKRYNDIVDYLNSMVPRFIMGTEELDENTFKAFADQLNVYGAEELTTIYQDAYDRYLTR
ncbi:MAG: hypothetical protein ACOX58_10020 [Christensenellales bacterium]|jgi:putative aldouronate transport system substrate-binding protein